MAERAGSQTSGAPVREGGLTTFSFEVGNPLSAAKPTVGGAAARGGVVASTPRGVPQIDGRGLDKAAALASADIDNLMRFAGAILGPKIQQEQDAAYWEGVKKAAAGQSIQEILDEQPWYSQIFGDTPMVQGARAYTAQKNLNDTLLELGQNMAELRKLSPDQVTQTFVARLEGMMTGDPVTDAMLKKAASEQLPLLLKTHVKEHYAYLQSDIRIKQYDAWVPEASRLQEDGRALAAGMMSEQDFKTRQTQFLGAIMPVDGQNEESYRDNLKTFYVNMAQRGNFHAVRVLEENGMLDQLSPEERRSLEDSRHRYAQRAKADYVSQYMAEDLAALNAAARTNPYDTKTMADMARNINARFRLATGIDEDVVDVARTVETAAVTLYRAQESETNRLLQEETKRASATYGFAAGYGKSSYADLGLSATEADAVFVSLHDRSKDPMDLLIKNVIAPTPYVSPELKGRIMGQVAAGLGQPYSDSGIGALYQQWKELVSRPTGGRATAAAYFGDYHAQFMRMDDLIRGGRPPEVAYNLAFVAPPARSAALTRENQELLTAAIDRAEGVDGVLGWFRSILGTPLSPGARRQIENHIAPKFDEWMQLNPGHSPEGVAEDLVRTAWANGELEVYGEFAWSKDRNQTSFKDYANAHVPELLNKSVSKVLHEKARASGLEFDDNVTIMHLNDENGVPQVVAWGTTDGIKTIRVTGDEVKAQYEKELAALKNIGWGRRPRARFTGRAWAPRTGEGG